MIRPFSSNAIARTHRVLREPGIGLEWRGKERTTAVRNAVGYMRLALTGASGGSLTELAPDLLGVGMGELVQYDQGPPPRGSRGDEVSGGVMGIANMSEDLNLVMAVRGSRSWSGVAEADDRLLMMPRC